MILNPVFERDCLHPMSEELLAVPAVISHDLFKCFVSILLGFFELLESWRSLERTLGVVVFRHLILRI